MGNLLLEVCDLELENGKLELGAWYAGTQVPGAGCRVPGAGCRVPKLYYHFNLVSIYFLYSKRVNFRLSCPPDGTTAK